MRIESGPKTERIVRTSLFLLLCAIFSGWFTYDGLVGYPSANFRELLEQLPPEARSKVSVQDIYSSVTAESLVDAQKAVRKIGRQQQRAAIESLYGGPPSYEDEQFAYYFGPFYRVTLHLEGGKIRKVVGQKSPKSIQDCRFQKWLGGFLCVVSIVVLVILISIIRTRVVLDDDGLRFRGRKPVSWDAMRSLDDRRFRKKGRLDLIYADDNRDGRICLDEYHLAKFEEIVDEICSRKGFDNPVALEKAEKARAVG
ncbi:MAG: hypothetical protein ACE5EQ_04995 [Phycisphaerae bacterium]